MRREMQRSLVIAAAILATYAGASRADSWKTTGALYGQFASMSGETGVGPVSTDLDVSFSELLDHIDMAGMMALRSESEHSAATLNAVFTGLDGDVRSPSGTFHDVELTQDMVELTWSWRLDEQYEFLFGGRYQSVSADVTSTAVNGTSTQSFKVQHWFDPIIGVRGAWPLSEAWTLIGRADVGGFGVGSDLTWSALLLVDWGITPSFGIVAGYRALDTDYEDGSGNQAFKFDVLVAGPLLGIRFNFGP